MFKEENIVELAATKIPAKLESTRRYLPSPPLMIENHFIDNQKFLTNVEKMKLLDQPKLTDHWIKSFTSNIWKYGRVEN